MKLLARIVTTACACALLVRVTRLVRAWRKPGIVEYRVVEHARAFGVIGWSDGLDTYQPELHRYIVVNGCPFVEIYRERPIADYRDGTERHTFNVRKQDFAAVPMWGAIMLDCRSRLANGEPPDEFKPVERVQP